MATMHLGPTISIAGPAASGAISFTTPLAPQTGDEGGSVTFTWLATGPTAGAVTYQIQTIDPATNQVFEFGTQTATTKTFPGLVAGDSGTIVRVTATNGTDTPATSQATITVTPATSGGGGGASGGGLSLNRIYFHGHSLMNEGFTAGWRFSTDATSGSPGGNTPDYIGIACSAAGFVCHGVHSAPGYTAAQALSIIQGNKSAWIGADAVVLDFAINGDESGTQFKADAKAIADYIHSQNPAIHVAWIEAHSSNLGTTGAQSNVLSRWATKNPKLAELASEGSIDSVVPWQAYAETNKQLKSGGGLFYSGDGVHHWEDQRPYANRIIAHLQALTAGGGTGGTGGTGTGGSSSASRHIGFDNYASNHFGNPLPITGPGNIQIKTNSLAMPFKAVETGSITEIAFNLKYNNGNGYSGGTGGKARVDLYNADSTGRPTGSSIAGYTLNTVTAPGESISNGNGWVAPHALTSPAAVVKGQAYAIVWTNVDASPSSNFYSVNCMVEYPSGSNPPDDYYRDIQTGGGFLRLLIKGSSYWNPDGGSTWNDYEGRDDVTSGGALNWHNVCFECFYSSGNRQGQAYVGARYGDSSYERALSGSTQFRSKMLSKRTGRTATHLNFHPGMSGQLWPSGTQVGAIIRNASGTQLATATLTKNGNYWGRGALSTPIPIGAAEYWVDLRHLSGTALNIRALQTSLNGHGWEGAGFSDLPGGGLLLSTNSGSSFSQPGGGAAYDFALFFNTTEA